jgi:class 3 adenylate cyclase/tetratricopeptide (TPR) repeat protein
MPPRLRFCGECGAALPPNGEVPPSEERKIVTVLFADLVASTELATRLDPEDLRRLYTAYFDAMSGVLDRHGGIVEKFIGDAVVGIFGAPVTHEDDPERAVRAGLAMQAELVELNGEFAAELGDELALRIGIHTGEVVAAPSDSSQALVTGETTSIAARLQSIAPRGRVIVGGRTHRDAARSFVFDRLGDVELKGVPGPMDAWLVVGEAPTQREARDQPLVGRTDELALLDTLLRRCEREGRPHLVTVVGPAGIGKSRLMLEFVEAAGVRAVHGRCLPYGTGLYLWPFAEIVKGDASILDSDPPHVIESKARERIGRRFAESNGYASTLPTLLSSIGIPIDPDPLAGVGRDAAQRMITNAWSEYLSTLASGDTLIVWIEDLHWADDALLDLVDRLLDRIAAPVLFLCPARPDLFDRRPAWATRGASMSTFDLTPLSPSDGISLVGGALEGPADPELIGAIAERAGGSPFFARELVHMLKEEGSIARRGGAWVASADIGAAMPDTVQTAIAARIDRLQTPEKRVIQMASVVGRTFWVPGPDELSDAGVEGAIDVLMARGLIRLRPASAIEGSSEFTFEHALTREVAYGSIPRSRRAPAHRSVLDWMERGTRGRDEEFAELLAHHAEMAGDPARTARFAMLAGHRHRRVYAAEEAIRWYEVAATAAEQAPAGGTSSVRAELLHSRGEALEQLGRYEEARDDYEVALEIARAKQHPWLAAQELAAIANVFRSLERPEDAEAFIPLALEAAREAGFQYLEARVQCLAGALAWDRGDGARARTNHDEALRIAREARDLEAEAYARTGLTEIGLCQGPFDRAIADGERARRLWLGLGHRPNADSVAQMLGFLQLLLGDPAGAEALFDTSLAGARDLGIGRDEPFPLVGLALVAMTRGDLGRSLALFGDAVEAAVSSGATRGEIAARLGRVVLAQELGAPERAAADLDAVDALAPDTAPYLRSIRLAARGWLDVAGGQREKATARFARARSASDGMLLSRIAAGRVEILAWSAARDEAAMSDSAAWLLNGVADEGPGAEALARWALARTGRDGGAAAASLELARRVGDRTLLWRACVAGSVEARRPGDTALAASLREEACEIVRSMADSLPDEDLRTRFRSGSEVADLLRGDGTGS